MSIMVSSGTNMSYFGRAANFLRGVLHQFWQSFFLDQRFFVMLLYTTLMVAVLFVLAGLVSGAFSFITNANLGSIDPAIIQQLSAQKIGGANSSILTWFVEAGVILVIALFIHLLVISVGEVMAWLTLAKISPSFQLLKKAYVVAIAWFFVWILPLTLLLLGLNKELFALIASPGSWVGGVLFVVLYVHTLLCLEYMVVFHNSNEEKKSSQNIRIWQSIKKVFTYGLGRLHLFIPAYVLVVCSYLVWALATNFVLQNVLQNVFYSFFSGMTGSRIILGIQILAAIIFVTWFRQYFAIVANEKLE